MNLAQFREKYPQYNGVGDDTLVKALHKKYYPNMDYDEFAGRMGYTLQQNIPEFTPEMREQAERMAQGMIDRAGKQSVTGGAISGFGEGVASGLSKLASGATLGTSDWLDRKTGGNVAALNNRVQARADSLGGKLGTANRALNFGNELVGNMAGAGNAVVKGLGKLGLRGFGLASASGGLESSIYGATNSDKLSDLPFNMTVGGAVGSVLPVATTYAVRPFVKYGAPLANRLAGTYEVGKDYLRNGGSASDVGHKLGEVWKPKKTVAPVEDNPFGKRSFVEALGDRRLTRKMRNGVLAGAEDIGDAARELQDNMARRAAGWKDSRFEDLISTPEMKEARKAYADFMTNNGNETMDPFDIAYFYQRHPVAKKMIKELRKVDPRAFDDVERGTLAEFDVLKNALRNQKTAGLKAGERASKADALDRAEKELKSIMEKEFNGFKDVNTQYAKATANQRIFENKLNRDLTSLAGGTAATTPFWTGISAPTTAAGIGLGIARPEYLVTTGAGLGGKIFMRGSRRKEARDIMNGIVRQPVVVSPLLASGLSQTALHNIWSK